MDHIYISEEYSGNFGACKYCTGEDEVQHDIVRINMVGGNTTICFCWKHFFEFAEAIDRFASENINEDATKGELK